MATCQAGVKTILSAGVAGVTNRVQKTRQKQIKNNQAILFSTLQRDICDVVVGYKRPSVAVPLHADGHTSLPMRS